MLILGLERFSWYCFFGEKAKTNTCLDSGRKTSQKRPDVHKFVLSIKLRPPPGKLSILRILCWFVQFSSFWALFGGGGGGKPNFVDKNFMDTQTFLNKVCWNTHISGKRNHANRKGLGEVAPNSSAMNPNLKEAPPHPKPFQKHKTKPWETIQKDGLEEARRPGRRPKQNNRELSCTRLRVPRVALHVSRYTCRATRVAADFLDLTAFCRCSSGVAPHPLKILVSHLPPHSREVSHRNLGLKRCRATQGCRRYTCGCRATVCN